MTQPAGPPGDQAPPPRLTPTRPGTLALAALLAGLVAWVLVGRFYGDLPQLTWFPTLTLVAIAVVEAAAASTTRARIERRPGTRPVEPLQVARLAALAKASSLAGALFAGLYGGLLLWVFAERNRLAAAADDVPEAAGGVVAAVLLTAAALWLERACRIPRTPDLGTADEGAGEDPA